MIHYNIICFYEQSDMKYHKFDRMARMQTNALFENIAGDLIVGGAEHDIHLLYTDMLGKLSGIMMAPVAIVDWQKTAVPDAWVDDDGIHWVCDEGESAFRTKVADAIDDGLWVTYNLLSVPEEHEECS